MPWTEITRPQYQRMARRYASDLTDREWEFLAPFMPAQCRLGRPRTTDLRQVVDALLYIASTGCQWRQLPKDFPPYSTVQGYFYRWAEDGMLARINHALVMAVREAVGREASPSAGVIDSQSVKTTESGGHAATMPGRRSRVASATSSPIRSETWSACWCMPPTSKIVTVRPRCSRRSGNFIHGCGTSSPMAATRATSCAANWLAWAVGWSRSSSGRTRQKASRFCRDVGSSSARSLGSTAAAGLPRTSRRRSQAPPPGCLCRTSACSRAGLQEREACDPFRVRL